MRTIIIILIAIMSTYGYILSEDGYLLVVPDDNKANVSIFVNYDPVGYLVMSSGLLCNMYGEKPYIIVNNKVIGLTAFDYDKESGIFVYSIDVDYIVELDSMLRSNDVVYISYVSEDYFSAKDPFGLSTGNAYSLYAKESNNDK